MIQKASTALDGCEIQSTYNLIVIPIYLYIIMAIVISYNHRYSQFDYSYINWQESINTHSRMSQDELKRETKQLLNRINFELLSCYSQVQMQLERTNKSSDSEGEGQIYYLNQENSISQTYYKASQLWEKVPEIPYSAELNSQLNRLADPKYMSQHKTKLFDRLRSTKRQYYHELMANISTNTKPLPISLPSSPISQLQIHLSYKQQTSTLKITPSRLDSIKQGQLNQQIILNYLQILKLVNIIKNVLIFNFTFIQKLMGKYWVQIYQKHQKQSQISIELLKTQIKGNYDKIVKQQNLRGVNIFEHEYLIVPVYFQGLFSCIIVQGLNSLKSQVGMPNEDDMNQNGQNNRRLQRGQLYNHNLVHPNFNLSKINIILCNNFIKMKPLAVDMLTLFIKKAFHQRYNHFIFTKSSIPHHQIMLPKHFVKKDSGLYLMTILQILFSNEDCELGEMMKVECRKKLHLYPHPVPLLLRERLWNLFVRLLQTDDGGQRGLMCKNFMNERIKISDRCRDLLDFDVIEERELIKYHPFSKNIRPLDKMNQNERYSFELSYYLDQTINQIDFESPL